MSQWRGPFLIAVAALLWATDALFRVRLVNTLHPTFIVFFEHLVCVTALLPWILLRKRREIFQLNFTQWCAVTLIGIGGSAIATVFFTASFKYVNPSVSILLQKLQPVWVTLLAILLLKERPQKGFFFWGLLALAAAVVLSFPDLNFNFMKEGVDLKSKGVSYALIAAGLWGVATVAGKILLNSIPPSVVSFWRFIFGWITLGILLLLSETSIPWEVIQQPDTLRTLAYMGLVPGLAAMVCYYSGLQRTKATTTTFIELIFPVAAVALNTYFLSIPLEPVQIVGGILLLVAVTNISYRNGASQ
ncbi:MAG: DMT family transporter [Methylotenera sp.]|nr:DMT family transporter [Oligoflexia bacterium]